MASERMLMATVTDLQGHMEAEPVLVGREGDYVRLKLDDGTFVLLGHAELAEAIEEEAA